MLFVGNWYQIALAIIGGFAGIYALTVTTEGWLLNKVGWPVRILMAICALLFFTPGLDVSFAGLRLDLPQWVTFLTAFVILVAVLFIHYSKQRDLGKGVTG
jgi:TRAP-type uncharacterized transport system fused permease subunit